MIDKINVKSGVFLLFMSLALASCKNKFDTNVKRYSPSKTYYLMTSVPQTDKSKPDYAEVVISVFDNNGQNDFIFNTNASDFSKWAVGWDNQKDVIILNSSDIGTIAWKIENNHPVKIDLSESIIQRSKELKAEKYN